VRREFDLPLTFDDPIAIGSRLTIFTGVATP
jgi:hypothetical protein